MPPSRFNRRRFIQCSAALSGFAIWLDHDRRASGFQNPNDRPTIGVVGTGSRWDHRATGLTGDYGSGKEFPKYGDILAVCDADAARTERAAELVKQWGGKPVDQVVDYRKIIDRDDIDLVHISTPDHWHAKIAIEAMLSGKDVYCEKPMTLTIPEGRLMSEVTTRTGRIVQIGTQQRSDYKFLKAIAMIRDGRIGQLQKIRCSLGEGPTSPQLPIAGPPKTLDWNQWLGPAPKVDYRRLDGEYGETKGWSRSHYEFRWWYEYSGGKLTDWGAHHVDIASWAANKTDTGPVSVNPVMVKHPVPFQNGFPTLDDRFNTATEFNFQVLYDDGLELEIRHDGDNGIIFEGTSGRIFINRGRLSGKPVEQLEQNPISHDKIEAVYKGRQLTDHFRNFFDSVVDRKDPVSDVHSHHRGLSTCHLAGIAARLNRKLLWDPSTEQIVGDNQAQDLIRRDNRQGFEIEM